MTNLEAAPTAPKAQNANIQEASSISFITKAPKSPKFKKKLRIMSDTNSFILSPSTSSGRQYFTPVYNKSPRQLAVGAQPSAEGEAAARKEVEYLLKRMLNL